jgi:hypothetical protein
MNTIYSVYFVNINNSNIEILNNVNLNCLEIFDELYKALNYVNNMKDFEINNKNYQVIKFINTKPTTKDVNGLYFVYDKNLHKFNIYLKNTIENKGYIYNTVDVNIEYKGYIEIITNNVLFNLNEKKENELTKLNKIIIKKKNNKSHEVICNINQKLLEELKNKLDNLNIKKNK